jgi:hypothetical protein
MIALLRMCPFRPELIASIQVASKPGIRQLLAIASDFLDKKRIAAARERHFLALKSGFGYVSRAVPVIDAGIREKSPHFD